MSAKDFGCDAAFDTVIVGGGAAGAYCLLRFADDPSRAGKICLIEASPRLGGRVLSVTEGSAVAELGAMRYMQHHILVKGLIETFDLKSISDAHQYNVSSLHLRGCRIPFDDEAPALRGLSPRFDEIYLLDQEERGRTPERLIHLAIFRTCKDILSNLEERSRYDSSCENLKSWLTEVMSTGPERPWPYLSPRLAEDLRSKASFDGVPLNNSAFWNVVQAQVSTEAFHLIRDGLGYYTITSEWNAAEALIRFINELGIKDSPVFSTLKGGMDQLLDSMFAAAAENVSVQFAMEQYVRRVTRLKGKRSKTFVVEMYGARDGTCRKIACKNLIICLTQAAVARIDFVGFGNVKEPEMERTKRFEEFFHDNIQFVAGHPLQKIILGYDTAWWETKFNPNMKARSKIITDVAVRQIYFDPSNEDRPFIMIYIDGPPLAAWRSFRSKGTRDKFYPIFGRQGAHRERAADLQVANEISVSERMYRQIRRLFARILQIDPSGIPEPTTAIMKSWNDLPDTAGWHAWTSNAESTRVRNWLARPLPNEADIFGICGEAFSSPQGWIEAAFRSGELLLQRHGFETPTWSFARDMGPDVFDDYIRF